MFTFLDKNAEKPLHGLCMMYPSPGTIERIGSDWDWLWIDAQHGDLDSRDVTNLVRASHLIKVPAIVRIPSHDESWTSKVLDTGAAGVIVPMVETLDEARRMVRASKFPPLGNRSYGGRRVIDLQGRGYYETANRDTILILQVESNEACGISEAMAAIDGVDGLFVGPDDLLIRSGHKVDAPKDKATLGHQHKIVADACKKYGKLSVCVAASDLQMEFSKEYGYDLAVAGGDVAFLSVGSKTTSQKARNFYRQSGETCSHKSGSEIY